MNISTYQISSRIFAAREEGSCCVRLENMMARTLRSKKQCNSNSKVYTDLRVNSKLHRNYMAAAYIWYVANSSYLEDNWLQFRVLSPSLFKYGKQCAQMRVCHMHFRHRILDKCYSRIHSHGELTQVELCLLVSDTKPFLPGFTKGIQSRYYSDSSNRNIPSLVQINHILNCKPHTQAGFHTQIQNLWSTSLSLPH